MPKKPSDAAPEQPAPAKKAPVSPLVAQVNALLVRGDNLGAKALLAQAQPSPADEAELAEVRARLRFDPGALAAAGGVLAAILFSLVAAILLRK
jgi:hypothetical protein